MNINEIKAYANRYTSRFWFWYALAGLAAIIFYPFIVSLLSQQFSVYHIYVGNPATYIGVYVVYGLWFGNYYMKRWGHGKMGLRGNILLFAGAIVILLVLVYVFDYKFSFLPKGG